MISATARRSHPWILCLVFGLLAAQFLGCAAVQETPQEPAPPAPVVETVAPAPPPPAPAPPPPPSTAPTKIMATVTAHALNVRQGPSGSELIVGLLHKGDQVEVRDYSGIWYQITTPNIPTGWVSGKYLEFMEVNNPSAAPTMSTTPGTVPQPIIEQAAPAQEQLIEAETIEKTLSE